MYTKLITMLLPFRIRLLPASSLKGHNQTPVEVLVISMHVHFSFYMTNDKE